MSTARRRAGGQGSPSGKGGVKTARDDDTDTTSTRGAAGHRHKKTSPFGIILRMVAAVLLSVLGFFLYVYNVSPDNYPVVYTLPSPPSLEVNNLLASAERLFEGEIFAPEAFVYKDGAVYMGTSDGKIIRMMTGKISTIVQLGTPCGAASTGTKACSRPLGLKFDKTTKPHNLIIADAGLGLLKLEPNRTVTVLLAKGQLIGGKPLNFLNGVDVDSDGIIYFSQTSSYDVKDAVKDMMDGRPSGRLMRYDPEMNTTEILIDNLRGANGVKLSKNGQFVLVAESWNARILKYHIEGDKAGQSEIFADNLPCLPDNIQLSRSGGFWTSSGFPRYAENPHINALDVLGPRPWLRQILIWLPLEKIMSLSPVGSILVELNMEGEVVRTLMDEDGKTVRLSSDVIELDEGTYIGSHSESYIAFIKK